MITDAMLRLLKKNPKLDAGYNNITLTAGKQVGLKSELDLSDDDIEKLIQRISRELLRARRELRKKS